MLKLDFFNNNYSLEEVIDAYTGGSIDNFKGDEDFLNFLISWSLGEHLVGPDADKFKDYAKYEGILNTMRLDEYGYLGEKAYKIYEICGKDKMKFMEVSNAIGQYSFKHTLEKETIDRNLELKEPVAFLDETIILSSGKKPEYNPMDILSFHYDLSLDEEEEYTHELERSLRHRINESIRKNKDDLSLLEEMPSYIDKKRIEEEEKEQKMVQDDHLVDINNLYFGTQTLDVSGGLLGINMKLVSWFEYTNIDILKYHVFRSIPEGDYCLLDDNGSLHIPNEILKKDNITVGPNSPIRSLQIASVPTIFNKGIEKLEENPNEDEETILGCRGIFELLENEGTISVGEIKIYESMVRSLYELTFGDIFKDDKDAKYYTGNDGNKTHK